MRALSLVLLAAGCGTDLFELPYSRPIDLAFGSDGNLGGDLGNADLAGVDALTGMDDLSTGDQGVLALPPSCALLGCVPTVNEGDADLDSGEVSGCHAYGRLSISGVVQIGKSDGPGFTACADHIILGFSLSGDGRGYDSGKGPGSGGSCGSGGGHGGAGADATGCNGGAAYDDPNQPRQPGSGGGSFGGGGGAGGGSIELAADRVEVLGFVTVNGQTGSGAVAGGGGGGSILIRANQLVGTGQVQARGGPGLGLGGGGGGGRVAIYATTNAATLNIDVAGGGSMSGGSGAAGTVIQP